MGDTTSPIAQAAADSSPTSSPPIAKEQRREVQAVVPTEAAWPWARLLARLIDIQVESAIIGAALAMAAPTVAIGIDNAVHGNQYAWGILLLPFAMLLDAIMMASFGTTLGKRLAGVHVQIRDGRRLSFAQCINRNVDVYLRGLALGLPLVNLVTMSLAARRLRLGMRTAWDDRGEYLVLGERLAWYRWAVLVGLLIGVQFANAILNAAGPKPQLGQAQLSGAPQTLTPVPVAPDELTWMNPITGRSASLQTGWKPKDFGIEGATAFVNSAEDRLVILAHEDMSYEIENPAGEFLERYLDVLEASNPKWGKRASRDHGDGTKWGTISGRYVGAEFDGVKVDLEVKVWTFGGRKVWRSLVIIPSGKSWGDAGWVQYSLKETTYP